MSKVKDEWQRQADEFMLDDNLLEDWSCTEDEMCFDELVCRGGYAHKLAYTATEISYILDMPVWRVKEDMALGKLKSTQEITLVSTAEQIDAWLGR